MPDLGSRSALIGAITFALLVVFLSISGIQPLGLLLPGLYVIPPLIAMYFIVRWAVSAGIHDASKKRNIEHHLRTPREILDERYARSEISREDYEQVRQDLQTR